VPIFYYPLIEHALRATAGRSTDEHVRWIASWWARFTDVAAGHEHAWSRERLTADDIATPGPDNRLVSSPYPKVMNANIQVDQAAALILCSAGAAEAAGIARDRWVFVHATAGAHDHWFMGERPALDRSPALAAAGHAALGHAGTTIDEVAHLDLYSCFPSAVQVAARELGVELDDPARVPTVTGGLAFFGGPANDYVTHSVATLVDHLRADPGARGLATAVGWYLTKHGVALLGGEPGPADFRAFDVQDEVDAGPRVAIAEGWAGAAPVETYTALYDRDGTATMGVVAVRTPDGDRAFAKTHDRDTIDVLLGDEALGREARLDGEAGFTLAD
jgi:acetyl-CoA C-acetyltransferase